MAEHLKKRDQELETTRGELKATQAKVAELNAKVAERETAFNTLQQQGNQVVSELEARLKQIEAQSQSINVLNQQLADQTALIQQASQSGGEQAQAQLVVLTHHLKAANKTALDNETALQAALTANLERDNRIRSQQEALDKQASIINNLERTKAADLKNLRTALDQEKASFANRCQHDIGELQVELELKKAKAKERDGELTKATKKLRDQEGRINTFHEKWAHLESWARNLEAHSNKLQRQLEEGHNQFLAKDQELVRLQNEAGVLRDQSQEFDALKQLLESTSKNLAAQQEYTTNLQLETEKFKKSAQRIAPLEKQLELKDRELEAKKADLAKAQEEAAKTQEEAAKAQEEASNSASKYREKHLAIAAYLKRLLKDKDDELRAKATELAKAEEERSTLKSESSAAAAALKEELDSKRREIESKDKELASLEQSLAAESKRSSPEVSEEQPTQPNKEQPTQPNKEQPAQPNKEQPAQPNKELLQALKKELSAELSVELKRELKREVAGQLKKKLAKVQQKTTNADIEALTGELARLKLAYQEERKIHEKTAVVLPKWIASRETYKERALYAEGFLSQVLSPEDIGRYFNEVHERSIARGLPSIVIEA